MIRGAMENWGAMTRWSDPEYLPRIFRDKQLPPAGNAFSGSMADFCRDLFTGGEKAQGYLERPITNYGAPAILGELAGDIEVPPFFQPAPHLASKIFAGWNSRCSVHYHPSAEATLSQVLGRKRGLLFPPDGRNLGHLYPYHWLSRSFSFSKVEFGTDGSWPDLTKFPRLAQSRPIAVELDPGDMLYIPIYWWHVLFGVEGSMSVTHLWMASLRKRYFCRMGLRSNYINARIVRRHMQLESLRSWRKLRKVG